MHSRRLMGERQPRPSKKPASRCEPGAFAIILLRPYVKAIRIGALTAITAKRAAAVVLTALIAGRVPWIDAFSSNQVENVHFSYPISKSGPL